MSYDNPRRPIIDAVPVQVQPAVALLAVDESDHRDADEYASTEGMRVFLDSLPGGLASGLLGVAVMSWILHRLGVREGLASWSAVQVSLLLLGFLAYGLYRAGGAAAANVRRWGRRFVWIAAFSALGWGSAGFYFVPGTPTVEFVTILAVSAIVIGSIGHMAAHLPVYFAFMVAAELPLALALLRVGDLPHTALSVGVAALMFGLPLFAVQAHRSIRQSFLLAHQNRELARALEQRSREAESANLAKSRFLASASHDLRQPVHALGLLIDVLRGQGLNDAQAETVAQLARSTEALEGLFNGLMDISKLDAGAVEVRNSALPLAPLLTALAAEFAPEARAKGLRLRVRTLPVMVRSDALLLGRVLRNLLANALRYTDSGGVLLACRRRGEDVAVELWDTGKGIAAAEQAAVFEEFYQCANPERDRALGLGLGLAIVQRLVRLLDIQLTLRSRPGRGTLFRLQLTTVAAEQRAITAPDLAVTPAAPLAARFVVVVDDDALVRVATEKLFAGWGCATIACADLAELRRVSADWSRAPDLLVTDLRLSGDDNGMTVIDWLREEYNCHTPAVIMTGDVVVPTVQADPHTLVLHKPVTPHALREAVQTLLVSRDEPQPCRTLSC